MENLTLKEKKCVRYLAGEMAKEDEMVFEIELSIDNELQLLHNRYQKKSKFYPLNKEVLNREHSQQKIQGEIQKKRSSSKKYILLQQY